LKRTERSARVYRCTENLDGRSAGQDALHLRGFDEIVLSTLPWRLSRWMHVDLPRKVSALGLPVLHVTADEPARLEEPFAEVA
jgi:hypothetical protein